MRDPYLFEEIDTLKNIPGIKDASILQKVEADVTHICMQSMYFASYEKFDIGTVKEIHLSIFGELYDWAGEFRSIQIYKNEDVIGGESVEYSSPKKIEKELKSTLKELDKLYTAKIDDKERVFRLTRVIARIWHIHPFREGNTRTVILLLVLISKKMGYEVNYSIFSDNASYVRNALVWCTQGIYSKYEYLEHIAYDAILGEKEVDKSTASTDNKYAMIGDYKVAEYIPKEHKYKES